MARHYEVESEINPRYKETGRAEDYHGIYHVVEYDGEIRVRVVRSYDDTYTSHEMRTEAYKYAAHLNKLAALNAEVLAKRFYLELRTDDKIEVFGFGDGLYILTAEEAVDLRNALVAATRKFTLNQMEAWTLRDADKGVPRGYLAEAFGGAMADEIVTKLLLLGFLTEGDKREVFTTDAGRKALADYRALRGFGLGENKK